MLRRVLVASTLPHEVLSLRVVALTRAALSQSRGAAAVLLGTVVLEHILQKAHQISSFAAAAASLTFTFDA